MTIEEVLKELTPVLCKLVKETFECKQDYMFSYIYPSLSLKQQSTKQNYVEDLDLASLIRVITFNVTNQNELFIEELPMGYKNFCFEMTAIRNKYAHKNSIQIKLDDEIRYIDTIYRFMKPLKIDNFYKNRIKQIKENF